MPICITCSTPVKHLYTTYSKADDRSLGKGVRLTQCPNCKRFADKYVEHDFVVLFIDLVLIKPQVYRHLLFNRLGRSDDKLDPSILRLGTLLVLFDVYITWSRIERSNSSATDGVSRLADLPILTQYLFFLTMNVAATIAQHGVIRTLARLFVSKPPSTAGGGGSASGSGGSSPLPGGGGGVVSDGMSAAATAHASPSAAPAPDASNPTPGDTASPSAISTALLVSSCTKLFPILLVIWPTQQDPSSASLQGNNGGDGGSGWSFFASRASNYVGWAVLLNNIEALLILLDCGYVVATGLAVAGMVTRWMVEGWCLGMVGLGGREAGLGILGGWEG